MKNKRLDTADVFQTIIGRQKEGEQPKKDIELSSNINSNRVGRTPKQEKNIQVSIYLTPTQAKTLRMQSAEKIKENDKSAITRVGLDIVLSLSNEEYVFLKKKAKERNVKIAEIVKEALVFFYKKEIE